MKPGDHPEFFRFPSPPGTSRESTIRLDADGVFWHDGGIVEKGALSDALHRWISVHPDDGRFILTNGYDWTYFKVDATPYFVVSVQGDRSPELVLSDQTTESLDPTTLTVDDQGVCRARVKLGKFEAKFSRNAQRELDRWMAADEPVRLVIDGKDFPLPTT